MLNNDVNFCLSFICKFEWVLTKCVPSPFGLVNCKYYTDGNKRWQINWYKTVYNIVSHM